MRRKETVYLLLAVATSTLLAEQSPFDLQSNLQKIEHDQQMILEALKSESPSDDDFGLEEKTVLAQQVKSKEAHTAPTTTQKPHPYQTQGDNKQAEHKEALQQPKQSQNTAKINVSSHPTVKQTTVSQAKTKKTVQEINAAVSKLNDLLKEDRLQYAQKIAEKSDKKPKSTTKSTVQQKDEAQADFKKALHEAIRAVDKE